MSQSILVHRVVSVTKKVTFFPETHDRSEAFYATNFEVLDENGNTVSIRLYSDKKLEIKE